MIQEYYILSDEGAKGPYDLVALIRKIRNGSLTPETLLERHGSAGKKQAQAWEELREFFDEAKDEAGPHHTSGASQTQGLGPRLGAGWKFLQDNQTSTVFSALYILPVILLITFSYSILPGRLSMIGYMVSFIVSHFLLSCYLLCVLRMTRGQPIDLFYLMEKIGPFAPQLLKASCMISLPAIVGLSFLISSNAFFSVGGLLMLIIPGFSFLTIYAFTPLLILDQEYGFREAMELSQTTLIKHGWQTVGVVFALFVINFVAVTFVLLPMVVTLPITMCALVNLYDEFFA